MKPAAFNRLIKEVRQCTLCIKQLPLQPNPILRASSTARLLIIGQAPGTKVHETGIPWNDASGERLREWLDIPKSIFYDDKIVAIIPMGFCYPGKGETGDLPPRKECYDVWHEKLLAGMPHLELILLVGNYAQQAYLKKTRRENLTKTVQAWKSYLPRYMPLPHPSPLNNIWLFKNRWFENEVVPAMRERVQTLLANAPEDR